MARWLVWQGAIERSGRGWRPGWLTADIELAVMMAAAFLCGMICF